MQTDEPALEELRDGHLFPPVVIGVSDYESREYEEEIDGQIAVVDPLIQVAGRKGFEDMEPHAGQRRNSAQSVEYIVMRLRVRKCRRRNS